MEPEGALPFAQNLATSPRLTPNEFISEPPNLILEDCIALW